MTLDDLTHEPTTEESREELESRLMYFPDHSDGAEASELLMEMTPQEIEVLHFHFEFNLRVSSRAVDWVEGLVVRYLFADPTQKNLELKEFVIYHLKLTEQFVQMFIDKERLPMLGDPLHQTKPATHWQIYNIGKTTYQYACQSMNRLNVIRERIIPTTVIPN